MLSFGSGQLTKVVHSESSLGIHCGTVDGQFVRLQRSKKSEQKQMVFVLGRVESTSSVVL